jgi:hypothetical protein
VIMCCLVRAIAHLKGAVIDGYGAMMEWWLARENRRNSREEPGPVPLLPPRILHEIMRYWTRGPTGRIQHLV